MSKFKWELPELNKDRPIEHGNIRRITLPVDVVCKWTDKIVDEYDDEKDEVISYKSGFIMEVIPQSIVYKGQDTVFIGQSIMECKHVLKEVIVTEDKNYNICKKCGNPY